MGLGFQAKKNTYYDSVTLMVLNREIAKLDGVQDVMVGMATALNLDLAKNQGLIHPQMEALGPNDFFAILTSESQKATDEALIKLEDLIRNRNQIENEEYQPTTLESALKSMEDANLVLISLPGAYVFNEAKKAIEANKHVMIFSDQVTVEEEKKLKELAIQKGLMVMGPDCGTGIINGIPLAFANKVNRGEIGIIGASGTGIQAASVLIHRLGGGISQAIGVGGRDLSKEIGGLMMLEGIKALAEDPRTKVLLLISKPPSEEVAQKILSLGSKCGKPCVVCFIGDEKGLNTQHGAVVVNTLEAAAIEAVNLTKGWEDKTQNHNSDLLPLAKSLRERLQGSQKYIRGLYTGGSLCYEALYLLKRDLEGVYSNLEMEGCDRLDNVQRSLSHCCIDLGDDEFTLGRAHPMIDPTLRQIRLLKEAEDEEVAIILLDFMLGYGAHADPVGAILPQIDLAKEKAFELGRELIIIASLCGTDLDPQNYRKQEEMLQEAGVVVMNSNTKAVQLGIEIIKLLE